MKITYRHQHHSASVTINAIRSGGRGRKKETGRNVNRNKCKSQANPKGFARKSRAHILYLNTATVGTSKFIGTTSLICIRKTGNLFLFFWKWIRFHSAWQLPAHTKYFQKICRIKSCSSSTLTACSFVGSIGTVGVAIAHPWHGYAFAIRTFACKLFGRANMFFYFA